MHRADDIVGVRGEKPELVMLTLDGIGLGTSRAMPRRPDASEECERPMSSNANHVGVFLGFVLAYSQNDVQGTTHRFSGLSHPRQCGDLVLRMLVIG